MPPTASRSIVALMAQAASSVSNVATMLIAARILTGSEFGKLAILISVLQVMVSLQTHGVGDTLTVFYEQSSLAKAIAVLQIGHVLAGSIVAVLAAKVLASVGWATAAVFGLLVAMWEIEEFARRSLMSRLLFGRQAAVDLSYLGLASGTLVALGFAGVGDLNSAILAMAAACFASACFGHLLLPADGRMSWRLAGVDRSAVRHVFLWGFWRSLTASTGNLTQVFLRIVIAAFTSYAFVGVVEAARLMIAPIFSVIAGMANVLLPHFARSNGRKTARQSPAIQILLPVVIVAYSALVVSYTQPIASALIGTDLTPSRILVISWLSTAILLALFNPSTIRAIIVLPAPLNFVIKALGATVSVLLAALICALGGALIAPLALSAGTAIAGWWTIHLLRKNRDDEPHKSQMIISREQ